MRDKDEPRVYVYILYTYNNIINIIMYLLLLLLRFVFCDGYNTQNDNIIIYYYIKYIYHNISLFVYEFIILYYLIIYYRVLRLWMGGGRKRTVSHYAQNYMSRVPNKNIILLFPKSYISNYSCACIYNIWLEDNLHIGKVPTAVACI